VELNLKSQAGQASADRLQLKRQSKTQETKAVFRKVADFPDYLSAFPRTY
jgi:hypothetical protein